MSQRENKRKDVSKYLKIFFSSRILNRQNNFLPSSSLAAHVQREKAGMGKPMKNNLVALDFGRWNC